MKQTTSHKLVSELVQKASKAWRFGVCERSSGDRTWTSIEECDEEREDVLKGGWKILWDLLGVFQDPKLDPRTLAEGQILTQSKRIHFVVNGKQGI